MQRRVCAGGLELPKTGKRALALALSVWLSGCAGDLQTPVSGHETPLQADKMLIVDCLLPPQVRRLGTQVSYLAARRPIKTSAMDCEIRGGEYVAFDRADYATALKVWLPQAQAGDPQAQNYVGQIYAQGLGLPPDYETAAMWYRRAADQNYAQAQINLGNLYEQGFGVPQDRVEALNWYRRASGVGGDQLQFASSVVASEATQAELQQLRAQVGEARAQAERYRQQISTLQSQLREREQRLQELQSSQQDKQLLLQLLEQQPATQERDEKIERLREDVVQYRAQLQAQEQELTQLRQQLRQSTQQEQLAMTQVAQVEAKRPPMIEVIDPPMVLTRGIRAAELEPKVRSKELIGRLDAPAGVKSFTVNDRPVSVDEMNLFFTEVMLAGESTPVRLRAIDRRDREVNFEFLLHSPQQQDAVTMTMDDLALGHYHALIIGNNEYQSLTDLTSAVTDARAVDEVLRQQYGFNTTLLINADRYTILSALNRLRETLTEQDNLLIYYAGHGELDQVNQRGHWLPVDAEYNNSANWISNVAITDMLNAMQARHVMVVADSCYSGTMAEGAVPRAMDGLQGEAQREWIEAIADLRARTVLTSGGVQPVLDNGGGQHSIFAQAFLDSLRDNRAVLEGHSLYREVLRKVRGQSRGLNREQVPVYAPIQNAGHEAGEFFFQPRG